MSGSQESVVSIQHDMPHEAPRPESVEIPTHVRQFIHELAPSQDAREVYHSVRREFPNDLLITQAQIYYWRRECVRRLYQMDIDELISSRMLINSGTRPTDIGRSMGDMTMPWVLRHLASPHLFLTVS